MDEIIILGLMALSLTWSVLFLWLEWADEYRRSILPGSLAVVTWWVTAGIWFAETVDTVLMPVAFLFFGFGIVAGAWLIYVIVVLLGTEAIGVRPSSLEED